MQTYQTREFEMPALRTGIHCGSFLYFEQTGSYRRLAPGFARVMEYARSIGLPSERPRAAVLLSDPEYTPEQELISRVGILLRDAGLPEIEMPFQAESLDGIRFCAAEYRGSLEDVPAFYRDMTKLLAAEGYSLCGYPMEVYLKDPSLAELDGHCHIRVHMPILG